MGKMELREWLKKNPKNSVVNDGGRELDLSEYYTEYEVKNIWVDDDEGETAVYYVSVELPQNRIKLIRFLNECVGPGGEEANFEEDVNILHIHYDGS
jgi:hypothetical protein